jgi:predicted enzyme related to lactoylglutathione lyase
MTTPVTYVELNSPDLEATAAFMRDVFGWEPQAFPAPDYTIVVEPFTLPGIGRGATSPTRPASSSGSDLSRPLTYIMTR